ncbi:hypothetical protein ACH4VX_06210 [Streptomyces sp. NPDC020731]|uniref:hypothetical protein n=1 Tax=Streptomyces sp. NPDC020731 TaxID=3365085 RepID=UPI0037AE00ED
MAAPPNALKKWEKARDGAPGLPGAAEDRPQGVPAAGPPGGGGLPRRRAGAAGGGARRTLSGRVDRAETGVAP